MAAASRSEDPSPTSTTHTHTHTHTRCFGDGVVDIKISATSTSVKNPKSYNKESNTYFLIVVLAKSQISESGSLWKYFFPSENLKLTEKLQIKRIFFLNHK